MAQDKKKREDDDIPLSMILLYELVLAGKSPCNPIKIFHSKFVNAGKNEDVVAFSHFKSTFLSNFMDQYVTIDESTGKRVKVISTYDTCYVLEDDYKGSAGGTSGFNKVYKDGSTVPIKYYSETDGYKCRWIDYVGKVSKFDGSSVPDNIQSKYRLSFK